MPTSTTSLPSGNTVRVRRVASMKNLTESQASSIGLANYYHRYANAFELSVYQYNGSANAGYFQKKLVLDFK